MPLLTDVRFPCHVFFLLIRAQAGCDGCCLESSTSRMSHFEIKGLGVGLDGLSRPPLAVPRNLRLVAYPFRSPDTNRHFTLVSERVSQASPLKLWKDRETARREDLDIKDASRRMETILSLSILFLSTFGSFKTTNPKHYRYPIASQKSIIRASRFDVLPFILPGEARHVCRL